MARRLYKPCKCNCTVGTQTRPPLGLSSWQSQAATAGALELTEVPAPLVWSSSGCCDKKLILPGGAHKSGLGITGIWGCGAMRCGVRCCCTSCLVVSRSANTKGNVWRVCSTCRPGGTKVAVIKGTQSCWACKDSQWGCCWPQLSLDDVRRPTACG